MVKIKQVLLFTAILILLVGVACASDVSEDTASTGSIAEEAAIHEYINYQIMLIAFKMIK